MNRSVAHVLTTEKTYFGYTTCEIFGILLMIVPFLIGLKFEAVDYWFEVFGHKVQEKRTEIRPSSILRPTWLKSKQNWTRTFVWKRKGQEK